VDSDSQKPGDGLPEPQLPGLRFGLMQFFWCVTGICLLLAAMAMLARTGTMSPLVLLMAVLVVALHIGGTAIGMRMRAHANERRVWEAARNQGTSGELTDEGHEGQPCTAAMQVMPEAKPRSPLYGHERPLGRLRQCVVAGAILGGVLGAVVLSLAIGSRTSPAGIAVGAVSTAIVGAWLAFVGANSWAIFRQGWIDAVEAAAPDKGRE
jgi:hypothetical protein